MRASIASLRMPMPHTNAEHRLGARVAKRNQSQSQMRAMLRHCLSNHNHNHISLLNLTVQQRLAGRRRLVFSNFVRKPLAHPMVGGSGSSESLLNLACRSMSACCPSFVICLHFYENAGNPLIVGRFSRRRFLIRPYHLRRRMRRFPRLFSSKRMRTVGTKLNRLSRRKSSSPSAGRALFSRAMQFPPLSGTASQRGRRANGKGDSWFQDGAARHGSTSPARKAASAMIAKIPAPLARHIAATYYPASPR